LFFLDFDEYVVTLSRDDSLSYIARTQLNWDGNNTHTHDKFLKIYVTCVSRHATVL